MRFSLSGYLKNISFPKHWSITKNYTLTSIPVYRPMQSQNIPCEQLNIITKIHPCSNPSHKFSFSLICVLEGCPLLLTMTVLIWCLSWNPTAATERAERFFENGTAFWAIAEGPLAGRVAWAFDRPGNESDPKNLLLSRIATSQQIEWASYKPTHKDIVETLTSHLGASGAFDGNYCTSICSQVFDDTPNVKPIMLDVYKPNRKRKWFVMHHKFVVLRSKQGDGVLTGSFNWTERATDLNFENLIYVKSTKLANAYSKVFRKLPTRLSIEVADGYFSAGFNDAGIELIKRSIAAAQKRILVAVWSISVASKRYPNPIYDALAKAVDRGVEVQVITDYHKAKKRKYQKLAVHSVRMRSKKAHMHHKYMVIDDLYVVSGSYNFVTKSVLGNHENVVVIKSPAMASSFSNQWNKMRNYKKP